MPMGLHVDAEITQIFKTKTAANVDLTSLPLTQTVKNTTANAQITQNPLIIEDLADALTILPYKTEDVLALENSHNLQTMISVNVPQDLSKMNQLLMFLLANALDISHLLNKQINADVLALMLNQKLIISPANVYLIIYKKKLTISTFPLSLFINAKNNYSYKFVLWYYQRHIQKTTNVYVLNKIMFQNTTH